MAKRIKEYLAYVDKLLARDDVDFDEEMRRHLVQIEFFMHERLIHSCNNLICDPYGRLLCDLCGDGKNTDLTVSGSTVCLTDPIYQALLFT